MRPEETPEDRLKESRAAVHPQDGLLRARSFAGSRWSVSARVAQVLLTYLGQVVLARLLAPSDFGTIALVTVFIGFAGIFSEFGLGAALIQQRRLEPQVISAVFRFSFLVTSMLAATMWLAAPLIESFYDVKALAGLTRLLAIGFLVASLGLVPRALMQRQMRFGALARADMVSASLGLLSTIAIAVRVRSPVALAWGSLVGSSAGAVLLWQNLRDYSWLTARGRFEREVLGYGAGLVGFTTINYWARNVDNLLIGKWLGPVALGLYSRAYNLMLLPVNQVVAALSPVLLPMLASLQADAERFRRAYISAVRAIAFVTFPMMAGLAVTAYPFIVVVFGRKWAEAAPLLEILAWAGLLQSLTNPTGLIFLATGGTARLLKWGLVGSSTCVLALVIGALLGSAKTVAAAYLVVNVLLTYPSIAFAGAPVGLRFGHVMAAVLHTVIATGSMTISVFCADRFLTIRLPILERLVLDVLLGVGIYATVSFAARNPALADFKRFLRMERSSP